MKYKNIKSVAHNIGHSFLSDMNGVMDDGHYVIVPRVLFHVAEQEGVSDVRIDLLTGTIDPPAVATAQVQEAVGHYVRRLPELLTSQSVLPAAVVGATLTIVFDYSRRRETISQPKETAQEFACTVELSDDRGCVHVGRPANWWMGS